MEITLQKAIDGEEIDLNYLKRSDMKWLMIELVDRKISFAVINKVLKRI